MTMRREFRDLAQSLRARGWRVVKAGSGHWKCYSPNGKDIVVLADTPSDRRAYRNSISRLKRAGLRT